LTTKQDVNELKVELKETKSEMIKWMFIFWVSQLAAIIAVIKFIK
jgi:hypothetical protein